MEERVDSGPGLTTTDESGKQVDPITELAVEHVLMSGDYGYDLSVSSGMVQYMLSAEERYKKQAERIAFIYDLKQKK